MKPNTMRTSLSPRTPGAVEDGWPRFAKKLATIPPLPMGEGRGDGELWEHCFSSLGQIWGATSIVLCLALAPLSVALSARADVLIGTNGERFVGKVIEEKTDALVFESEIGGQLTIPRTRIREIQRTLPAEPSQPANVPSQAAITSAPLTDADARANLTWQPPAVGHDGADWIQLRSGEWLRGHLKYVQERKVEFDSDELKDLALDLKNVRQIYPAKPFFAKFEGRDPIYGTVVVSNDVVQVLGPELVSLPRDQLTGITPGGTKEINFWSGKASIGLNFQSGNSKQASESASAELARRTPATVIQLNYLGNFSEVNGTQNANNHRVNAIFDIRLSHKWFLRPLQFEWYRDQLANTSHRVTAGLGVGYYIFDRPGLEWQVTGGPSYQYTKFETVEPGRADSTGTAAGVLQSSFKVDFTERLKFIQTFGATLTSQEAGLYTHHAVSTLEFEIKRHLDLNVSFVWDYLQDPKTDSSGVVPQHSDYRLIVGVGVKF
jgi:putative salt-induced outer membrane protein YdiY